MHSDSPHQSCDLAVLATLIARHFVPCHHHPSRPAARQMEMCEQWRQMRAIAGSFSLSRERVRAHGGMTGRRPTDGQRRRRTQSIRFGTTLVPETATRLPFSRRLQNAYRVKGAITERERGTDEVQAGRRRSRETTRPRAGVDGLSARNLRACGGEARGRGRAGLLASTAASPGR
jgi:hypothetical protein